MTKKSMIFLFLLFTQSLISSETRNSRGGFIDLNIYSYLSDVDNDNVITINIFSNLPNRFSYFSLINIGNQSGVSELKDTDSYYTEQNIRWKIFNESPFDLTLQANLRSGENNDKLRLGFRWSLNNTSFLQNIFTHLNLSYSINFHIIQFDVNPQYVWQIEHVFDMRFPYISDRLYLAGFIDHTFNEDVSVGIPNNPIVGEAQFGIRIIDNLYIIAEYHLNEYRINDVNNFAAGIEYMIKW